MTSPALAFNVRGCGRMYPWPPQPVDQLPLNQWRSVNPENIPAGLTPLPSVTNITSVLHKDLVGYGGEHAIRAGYENGWPADVDEAVEKYRRAADKHRNQRADAGTRAHTIAERLTQDLPLPSDISTEDEAFADAYLAFWTDHNPRVFHVEATVLNPDVGYGGTADLFAEVDGDIAVIDYKTRAKKPDEKKRKRYGLLYDENKLQLAALAHAPYLAVKHPDGWSYTDPPYLPDAGWGVVLYADGTYGVEVLDRDELDRWFDCFQGVLRAWRVLKGVQQEVAA